MGQIPRSTAKQRENAMASHPADKRQSIGQATAEAKTPEEGTSHTLTCNHTKAGRIPHPV
jgi:hypothetical protein